MVRVVDHIQPISRYRLTKKFHTYLDDHHPDDMLVPYVTCRRRDDSDSMRRRVKRLLCKICARQTLSQFASYNAEEIKELDIDSPLDVLN